MRLDLGQVLPELVDALGEGGAEPAVYADEGLEPREGVREGQEEQVDVALRYRGGLGRGLQGGQVIAVGLHHALGRSGGAGGVDDGGDVLARDAVHPLRELGLEAVGLVPAQALQRLPGERPRGRLAPS